jgi:ABC-2 type transport system ATP-binding protein
MEASMATLARLQGVRKRYGAVQALDGLDLTLVPGQLLALLGPNGAGKTTAIQLLLGLQTPDQGQVALFGRSPRELAARRGLGVMLQSAGIADNLRVDELLALTRSYYPQPRSVADCVAMAGLNGLLDRRYGRLSGGQQRRVQFALAICGRPRVLGLDEPTTGLDIEARQILWATLRELVAEGCAVLLTTHYLEEAEALADRVSVILGGRCIAEGSVAQIRAHVAQRRVRCVSVLPVDEITQWPQVRQVRRDGDRLEIVVDEAEDVVRRLLADDPSLSELEVSRAGLADAFLALTQDADTTARSLQEAA